MSGMADEEYFWEPVAGCWSLREGADGRWRLDGGGGGGPAPQPVPVTTIAWRIGHLAGLAVGGFADRLFGPGTLTADRIAFPNAVAAVPGFLTEQYRPWRHALAELTEEAWVRPLGPSWGPYAESSVFDLAIHVFDEVVHHEGEIGLMRDLFAHRGERG